MPALLTLYLKWYAMADASGFSRVARSIGAEHLRLRDVFSLFRADVLIGFIAVPLVILFFARYVNPRLVAVILGATGLVSNLLLAIQIRALAEVGRYISFSTMLIALKWGLLEPGANVGYLSVTGIFEFVTGCAGTVFLVVWAAKRAKHMPSPNLIRILRVGGEVYILCAVAFFAIGWKSSLPTTPYHRSTLIKSVISLWRENPVDTGEFAAFDFDSGKPPTAKLPELSAAELIDKYRHLANQPARKTDARYFGKQPGANVIFFVLETTPAEFLSVDDNMAEFPNLARLREHSFLAERNYTTLPVTDSALFSVFTSWYPVDTLQGPSGYSGGEVAPALISRMNAAGAHTAVFTPVHVTSAEAMYRDVGFKQIFEPAESVKDFYDRARWKDERLSSDLTALALTKSSLEKWMDSHQRFLAAVMPQVGHFPYADGYAPDSAQNLRERGRAIIKLEDSWLGQIMDLLQQHGQLDNTIIVVVGDHGRRNKRENPNLRLGTIDGTAFHVPLFIYAPRALAQPQRIPWITSHIDIAPTVLDLLGIEDGRDSEQGLPIWQSDLADRTTFFFAQPTFGADGYETDSRFYMWHYFSDSVYANSQAEFDMRNFIPREAPLANDITSKISTMVALEKQWHQRFAQPDPSRSDHN